MTPFELAFADFEEAAALARSVGWLDSADDWRTLAACAKCLGLRDSGGALIATSALCDFETVASVAKMVVRADQQRRGLGAQMLSAALAVKRPQALAMLIATQEGRPLYEKAGFAAVESIHFIAGVPSGVPASEADELRETELVAAVELDQEAAGCNREAMISARWHRAVRRFGLRRHGQLVAFGLLLPQGPGSIVGPLIAPDDDSAREVLHALLPRDGTRARVDVTARHAAFREHVLSLGLSEGVPRTEMTLGGVALPGRRALRYCPAALAYG